MNIDEPIHQYCTHMLSDVCLLGEVVGFERMLVLLGCKEVDYLLLINLLFFLLEGCFLDFHFSRLVFFWHRNIGLFFEFLLVGELSFSKWSSMCLLHETFSDIFHIDAIITEFILTIK